MSFKLRPVLLAAFAVALLAIPAFAQAASAPTYQVYKKCSNSYTCSGAAYFNKKHTRAINVQASAKCSDSSYVSVVWSGKTKVSSKGKFSVETPTNIYDRTAGTSVTGTGTLKGTVTKKKKVKLSYAVDNVPAACEKLKTGKLTLKYKGTQTGG